MRPLYYDIRHLIRSYDSSGASRTGIYRFELDVLEELLHEEIELNLFLEIKDQSKIESFESFLGIDFKSRCRFISNIRDINQGVFFSPIFSPPQEVIRKSSIIKVLMVHDVIPLKIEAYSHVCKEGTWFHSVIQCIHNKEIKVFVPSEVTRADLLDLGVDDQRITVCPHGLNSSTFNNSDFNKLDSASRKKYLSFKYNFPEKDYFLALGSIAPHKNLLRQLVAFEEILEQGNDVIFIFGGALTKIGSDYSNKIFEIVERNCNNIFYLGYVDDVDLKPLYENAIALVFTSEYEGFGFPALEAMRVGCPVITSQHSSVEEIVGQTGYLIDHISIKEHTQAYGFYLENMFNRQEIAKQAYERSLQFSYSNIVKLLRGYL